MVEAQHRELLKHSDMFRGLDDAQLERIAALGASQTFSEGAVVLQEDQRGGTFYFLLAGRVDIEIQPPFTGREPQKLATLKRGETFGELSLVDGYLRSASARAHDQVEVLAFENAALEALMDEDPRIGFRIMRNLASVLAGRIRSTNVRLRNAIADIFYY